MSLAQFILILDLTVVNVALPDLGADLDLSRTAFTWAISAYVLFFGGLLLHGGRFADIFGTRPMMLTGLVIFTLASLANQAHSSARSDSNTSVSPAPTRRSWASARAEAQIIWRCSPRCWDNETATATDRIYPVQDPLHGRGVSARWRTPTPTR